MSEAGASRLLDLVNEERRRAGVPPVARRGDVDAQAVEHSRAMASAGEIWHNDAYFTPSNRKRLGARRLGENVAMNADVEDAHRRLMLSEGHRRNLLDPGFSIVGFAVVRGEGRWFVTQAFVEPAYERAGAVPVAAPAPAAPPAGPAAPARHQSPTTTARPAAAAAARPVESVPPAPAQPAPTTPTVVATTADVPREPASPERTATEVQLGTGSSLAGADARQGSVAGPAGVAVGALALALRRLRRAGRRSVRR